MATSAVLAVASPTLSGQSLQAQPATTNTADGSNPKPLESNTAPQPTSVTGSNNSANVAEPVKSASATSSESVPMVVPIGRTITVNPQEAQPIKVEDVPVGPAVTATSAVSGGVVEAAPTIVSQVTISQEQQKIEIKFDQQAKETLISISGATVSTTQPVQVEQSKLYMETSAGPQEVKISPTEATEKIPEAVIVDEVRLEEGSEEPIYSISGSKEAKILFFIPVSVPVQTQVSAQTGQVVSVQKPWWSFLAW